MVITAIEDAQVRLLQNLAFDTPPSRNATGAFSTGSRVPLSTSASCPVPCFFLIFSAGFPLSFERISTPLPSFGGIGVGDSDTHASERDADGGGSETEEPSSAICIWEGKAIAVEISSPAALLRLWGGRRLA